MKTFDNNRSFNEWRKNIDTNKKVGFVPTMGALHEGHISLVKKAIEENDYSVVSIFVNPTQFNNKEDFAKYPNTLEKDIKLLQSVNCDVLFLPNSNEIYPNNELKIIPFSFSGIEKIMEGEFRPNHFDGVATVVKLLFDRIKPTRAYFGEKDYQQLLIINEMVKLEKMPIEIIGMPIFRESDGLAMSSRNMRLSKEFRKEATFIYDCLLLAKKMTTTNHSIDEIKTKINKLFSNSTLNLEYFEVRENNSLKFAKEFESAEKYRAFISVYAGEIRLIDNIELF